MKKLKNIALFTVLLLVLTSTFTTTVYADELVATEETFESEPVEVPYTWIYIQEKPEEQTIREKPHEETFSATEENFGDIDEEENVDNNESDESEEKDYAYRASFVITSDGVTVNETIGDNTTTVTTWDNNDESITKEDIMNDIENFIHNHDDDSESYTPDINLDKGSSYVNDTYNSNHNVENNVVEEEATYGPEEYDPSSIEILNNYGPKNSDDTVFINPEQDHGVYEGINWVYDPIEKKLTFTPGSSTIIPWISKDNYTSLPWMKYKDNVEKISVQDGITSIYANNFRDFSNLNKVYMSKDVTQISSFAFTGDNNIKDFIIKADSLDLTFDPDFYSNLTNNATITCNYSSTSGSTYDTAINSSKNVITVQMDGGTMDDVERIHQHTARISEVWSNTACVISSYEMLIERTAANEGYMSLSGDFSLTTGEDLVLKDTYNSEVLTSNGLMKWSDGNRTCKSFVKETTNGEYTSMKVNLKAIGNNTVTEDKLIELLKSHPEGVLVYQGYITSSGKDSAHAVLVTGYNSLTKNYSIMDPNNRNNVSTSDFTKLCGFQSFTTYYYYYVENVIN